MNRILNRHNKEIDGYKNIKTTKKQLKKSVEIGKIVLVNIDKN